MLAPAFPDRRLAWLILLVALLLGTPPYARAQEPTPTLASTPTAQPDGRILYTVAPGDTLTLIAIRFGLSLDNLYLLNSLGPDSILTVGQSLLLGRAQQVEANATAAVAGFPGTRVLSDGTIVHVVTEGDTLITIAVKYNLTLEELTDLSGLGEEGFLHIGQEVVVGHLPQPEATGGSADTPVGSPTPTQTPANATARSSASPTPTQALAVNATRPPAGQTGAAATPFAVSPPLPVDSQSVLPIFFGVVGLLALTGLLFLYLARRHAG
jgi:LysM repeat protein